MPFQCPTFWDFLRDQEAKEWEDFDAGAFTRSFSHRLHIKFDTLGGCRSWRAHFSPGSRCGTSHPFFLHSRTPLHGYRTRILTPPLKRPLRESPKAHIQERQGNYDIHAWWRRSRYVSFFLSFPPSPYTPHQLRRHPWALGSRVDGVAVSFYSDGMERLGAESARERVRRLGGSAPFGMSHGVGCSPNLAHNVFREVLDRSVVTGVWFGRGPATPTNCPTAGRAPSASTSEANSLRAHIHNPLLTTVVPSCAPQHPLRSVRNTVTHGLYACDPVDGEREYPLRF
jgi:hypothetical protein